MKETLTTQGSMIDRIFTLREMMRDLEKQISVLRDEKAEIEDNLLAEMAEQGIQSVSGKQATASISENIVPAVQDWDAFYVWIRRNNAFYLLQRRVNSAPYRELMDTRRGKALPGVSSVVLRTLNLRTKN